MDTRIQLNASSGGGDGYRGDLPLERDLEQPIMVDASALGPCHPMFAVRLRLFLDWHLSAGHEVRLLSPSDPRVAQQLADLGVGDRLPAQVARLPPAAAASLALLPVHRLRTPNDVEDISGAATDVLGEQAPELAVWGDPVYMAVSELCGNALQHGRDELGAYVAADRVDDDARQFRLAIADLGIGIPEHIRARHPEWQDDTAAITRALERGVSGTGDPQRGNGFAEVLDDAVDKLLVRTLSSVDVDIRSAKGRVAVKLVDGRQEAGPGRVEGDMALVFTLSDFGHTFATRERGVELREKLLLQAGGDQEVVVDFAGVTNVSYSFADEFLAKLCADAAVRVRPRNLSERVAGIADRAIERRAGTVAC